MPRHCRFTAPHCTVMRARTFTRHGQRMHQARCSLIIQRHAPFWSCSSQAERPPYRRRWRTNTKPTSLKYLHRRFEYGRRVTSAECIGAVDRSHALHVNPRVEGVPGPVGCRGRNENTMWLCWTLLHSNISGAISLLTHSHRTRPCESLDGDTGSEAFGKFAILRSTCKHCAACLRGATTC